MEGHSVLMVFPHELKLICFLQANIQLTCPAIVLTWGRSHLCPSFHAGVHIFFLDTLTKDNSSCNIPGIRVANTSVIFDLVAYSLSLVIRSTVPQNRISFLNYSLEQLEGFSLLIDKFFTSSKFSDQNLYALIFWLVFLLITAAWLA